MIVVTCEVFVNTHGVVQRALVFKVLRNVRTSAVLHLLGEGSDQWEIVRNNEVLLNVPFEDFERRINLMFNNHPIDSNACLLVRYDTFENHVSNVYMKTHGFSRSNVPWAEMAKHYREGRAMTQGEYRERFGLPGPGERRTGFEQQSYRETGVQLDQGADRERFSPEDNRAAEQAIEIAHG